MTELEASVKHLKEIVSGDLKSFEEMKAYYDKMVDEMEDEFTALKEEWCDSLREMEGNNLHNGVQLVHNTFKTLVDAGELVTKDSVIQKLVQDECFSALLRAEMLHLLLDVPALVNMAREELCQKLEPYTISLVKVKGRKFKEVALDLADLNPDIVINMLKEVTLVPGEEEEEEEENNAQPKEGKDVETSALFIGSERIVGR